MRLLADEEKKLQRARRLVEQVKMSFITRLNRRYPGVLAKPGEYEEADIETTKQLCNRLIAADTAILSVVLETPRSPAEQSRTV
jgi:hypothetical protein